MAAKPIVDPQAFNDIDDGYDWYERQREGLGEEFLNALHAKIRAIQKTPAMHPIVHENYRRALLQRFPYAIFYEYDKPNVIVYGVFPTSRDPNVWKNRL